MNIGIITHHYTANYGAVLQAYALSRFLQSLGHKVSIIDYRPWQLKTSYVLWDSKWDSLVPRLQSRYRFHQFAVEHLTLTPQTYFTRSAIQKHPPKMDAYICGSDRIWNWYPFPYKHFNPVYFLDFVDAETSTLIAYAAGFSRLEILPEHREEIISLLRRFDHISAREESGKRIVQDLLGIEVPIAIDPSLLLQASEYQKVESPTNICGAGEYIFVYNLEYSEGFAHLVEKVAEIIKLPIIVTGYSLIPSVHTAFDAGPPEWLWLLRNARYVCTNSFHGITFSLIFKKQFIAYKRTYGNDRLETILRLADLEDRLCMPESTGSEETKLMRPIDCCRIGSLLSRHVELSKQFLKSATGCVGR